MTSLVQTNQQKTTAKRVKVVGSIALQCRRRLKGGINGTA